MSTKSYNLAALICFVFTILVLSSFPIFLLGQTRFETGGDDVLHIKGQWFLSYQAGNVKGNDFIQFFLKRGYITIEKIYLQR